MSQHKTMGSSIFAVILLIIIKLSSCAHVLIVSPTASYSHQQPFLGLSRALASRGHNVTLITANPMKGNLTNIDQIDVHYTYDLWKKYQKENDINIQKQRTPFELLPHFEQVFTWNVDYALSHERVQRMLDNPDVKCDVVIYEGFYPGILGLTKKFGGIPSIVMFTVPSYFTVESSMGNPIFPSYMPSFLSASNDHMSLVERIKNIVYVLYHQYVQIYYGHPLQDAVMRKHFGNDLPPVEQLERDNSMLFLAGDLTQSYPAPHQPNTVLVGTLHIEPRQPLPDELKKWFDEAKEGVIYFSLGSNMQGTSLPEGTRSSLMNAFRRFPNHRFIFKWEADTPFQGKPENVLLRKWIPQQDLLAHPKLRLFITQGGHQSRQEATHFGVPMLLIPLFWDQEFNAQKIVTEGAGISVRLADISEDKMYHILNALLNNPSYKENMVRLSAISRDKPLPGAETAAWWVEYVIRHKGAPHLRPAKHQLAWYQLYCLDVLTLSLLTVAFIFYAVYFTIKTAIRLTSKKIETKNKKMN